MARDPLRCTTPEQLDDMDSGNYKDWAFSGETGDDLCLDCAKKSLIDERDTRVYYTHAGLEADRINDGDGIYCTDCGVEIIPPIEPNEE